LKIKPDKSDKTVIKTKQTAPSKFDPRKRKWWDANSKADLSDQVLGTLNYLKTNQQYRVTQASRYSLMYGNMPISGIIGTNFSRMNAGVSMPDDRPTMNVIQSCIDTLVSRVTQSKPRPIFLTDNGDHKMRSLAKQLNQFIMGEFYQCKAYRIGAQNLTDAGVLGTGCVQVYEDPGTKRVALDRLLQTELYVDPNDARYGKPTQLFRLKLIDRSVLMENFPEKAAAIGRAEASYPDNSADSTQGISDQVMVAEAWHLPSGKDAKDGLHTIVCSSGVLSEDDFQKERFPFAFMNYNPRSLGFWGQSLAEQLMGTQREINKLLMTISRSINLMGVPRVFIENGSKVAPGTFNNQIGSIVKYTGQPPIFSVAECIAPEIYAQLQRLIEYAYQQSGISQLSSQGQKPAGLNSGEALREYDDIQTDRFASLVRRYDDYYIDLAHLMIDCAKDIAERDGKYQTIYPNKDGTREINLPDAKALDNPFVIQCYDTSSLPRDPAGRKEYVVEMMQAGIYSPQEGRRLLGFADTEQVDKLENAGEERILQYLDEIVEHGKYTGPDSFMDLQLAEKLVVEYYNLYVPAKLSESKAQMLRDFKIQVDDLIKAAMPPPPPQMPGGSPPMAQPMPQPQNSLLPTS
jgi:hypothetical protein